MKISVGPQGFRGEAPRVAPRLLPETMAQAAVMTKLLRGSLSGWRAPLSQLTLPKSEA